MCVCMCCMQHCITILIKMMLRSSRPRPRRSGRPSQTLRRAFCVECWAFLECGREIPYKNGGFGWENPL